MTKLTKWMAALLAAVLLALPAAAEDTRPVVDHQRYEDQDCSISLELKYKEAPIPGCKLDLYLVAEVTEGEDYHFRYVTDLAGFDRESYPLGQDADLTEVVNGRTLADALSRFRQDNPGAMYPVQQQETDENGVAVFDDLPFGLYYVVQSNAVGGYQPLRPFLVTVPYWDETGAKWLYEVEATSKMEPIQPTPPKEEPEQPTQPTVPRPEGPLPQTGQLNWPVPVLAVGGMVLFLLGWRLNRRREDGSEAD